MGLPLWTVPQEPKSAHSEALTDRNQARARSTIRRQRTVRGRDPRLVAEERSRRIRDSLSQPSEPQSARLERSQSNEDLIAAAMAGGRELRAFAMTHRVPQLTRGDSSELRRVGRPSSNTHPSQGSGLEFRDDEVLLRSPTPPTGLYEESAASLGYQAPVPQWEDGASNTQRQAHSMSTNFEERYDRRARLYALYEERSRLRRSHLENPPEDDARRSSRIPSTAAPSPPMAPFTPEFAPARNYTTQNRADGARQSPYLSNQSLSADENRNQIHRSTSLPQAESRDRSESNEVVLRNLERLSRRRRMIMDGLGDRDRSLSPEGDGVWDTLLTTITPDPQPPSASSSFATQSAAATSAANSTGTSMTSIDNEATNTHPCEYDTEDGGHLHSEDDADQGNNETFRPRSFWQWRSYANVASAGQERYHGLDSPPGLTGMQRIVRGLASRQDIPDEWWAEAGLSRTLPQNGSETHI